MLKYDLLIFDMDGTITIPLIDFKVIRQEIGITEPGDLAVQVNELPSPQREKAWAVIHAHEEFAKNNQQLQPGFLEVMTFCRDNSVKVALLTRNRQPSVDALCDKFKLVFDYVLTREFEFMKPHPAPILHILEKLDVAASRTMMIGDYIHDIECGNGAGTDTCFVHNAGAVDYASQATYKVGNIADLIDKIS